MSEAKYKQKEFILALQFVAHAMGKKDMRPYLNAVNFVFDGDGNIKMTATDGHRMARIDVLPAQGTGDFVGQKLIHRDDALNLVKLYKGKGSELLIISVNEDGFLCFDNGAQSFKCDEMRGYSFPDCDRIIPKHDPEGAPLILLDPGYVADAMKAAKPLMSGKKGLAFETWDESRVIRFTVPLSIDNAAHAFALLMPMRG